MPWPKGPSSIIRIAMLLFVLVINATYTANLAAFVSHSTALLQLVWLVTRSGFLRCGFM